MKWSVVWSVMVVVWSEMVVVWSVMVVVWSEIVVVWSEMVVFCSGRISMCEYCDYITKNNLSTQSSSYIVKPNYMHI